METSIELDPRHEGRYQWVHDSETVVPKADLEPKPLQMLLQALLSITFGLVLAFSIHAWIKTEYQSISRDRVKLQQAREFHERSNQTMLAILNLDQPGTRNQAVGDIAAMITQLNMHMKHRPALRDVGQEYLETLLRMMEYAQNGTGNPQELAATYSIVRVKYFQRLESTLRLRVPSSTSG